MISIIIPTLNEEKFLPHLLSSIAAQTETNFEVIVVDGASKDNTVSASRTFGNHVPNFTIIETKKAGVSRQRNIGARKAKGEWFIFIDADSVLLPYALERILLFIKNEDPVIFTTWFRPDSEVSGDAMVTLLLNMSYEAAILLRRPFTQGTFTAVTREAFVNVGGYDEQIEFGEDYDLTKRICVAGTKLRVLRETLYLYSLRRFRHQRTLRTMQAIARAVFSVLLLNKTPRSLSGYVMGGQAYAKKQPPQVRGSALRHLNKRVRSLWRELIEV